MRIGVHSVVINIYFVSVIGVEIEIFINSILAMSNLSKLLKAGRLLFWDGKTATKASIPENVTKVTLGMKHSAIIGVSGNLYTFGSGQSGQLGHGNSENVTSPKIVDYFEKKNIKIIDVVCSEKSTLALSSEGEIYNLGLNYYHPNHTTGSWWQKSTSPTLLNAILPVKIPTSGRGKVTSIASGLNFHFAVLSKGSTEVWGCGEYGALGNLSTETLYEPTNHALLEPNTPDENIQKILSCNLSTAILRANGELYAWGSNNEGQFGPLGQTIDMHVLEALPTQILFGKLTGKNQAINFKFDDLTEADIKIPEMKRVFTSEQNQKYLDEVKRVKEKIATDYKKLAAENQGKMREQIAAISGQKIYGTPIVDFDLSENILLVKTKDSKIWKLGARLHFSPVEVALKEKVHLMSAGKSAVAFVTDQNQIIEQNDYFNLKGKAEDLTGFRRADGAALFDGKVIGMGGSFSEKKYVIIE